MILVELTDDGGQQKLVKMDEHNITLARLLNLAKSKFRRKFQYILWEGQWILNQEDLQSIMSQPSNGTKALAFTVSNRTPPADEPFRVPSRTHGLYYVIGNHMSTEDNALAQLKNASELQGVVAAIGMPDLHAGKGIPIGAVVITTEDCAYPQLVDNDIGCGMSFVETSLGKGRLNRNKLLSLATGMYSIDGPYGSVKQVQELCSQPTSWGPPRLGAFAAFGRLSLFKPWNHWWRKSFCRANGI